MYNGLILGNRIESPPDKIPLFHLELGLGAGVRVR